MSDERFMRTLALVGAERFERLKSSTVMVVGLGAVGGYALEALARSGIGKLILVDFDVVDISNINRQILATTSTIGQKKTELAKKRVNDINPDCEVVLKDVFVNQETVDELLQEKVDFVIDAIDSLNPKCCLMEALQQKDIHFISSMGAALKQNPACIELQKLKHTKNCRLAKFIRKRLVRRGVDIGKIWCVASDELVDEIPETALFMEEGKSRHSMGSLPTITAIFGLTIANAAILHLMKEA